MNLNYTVKKRFLDYVKIDTQSDPYSDKYPSTDKQKNLTKILAAELLEMGVINVEVDEYNYLIAKIPSNIDQKVPSIFFNAHVDTAPDCSGTGVDPILRPNYDGSVIKFPKNDKLLLDPKDHPNLKNKIGHDLVTSSGDTLLGSDDKSGLAIIMDSAYQLINNEDIDHGDIYILFTPDEEIGKGVKYLNPKKMPADFGYTLDGGDLGELNNENFSADSLVLKIKGVTAHPGYAKDKMEHAIKIASEIVSELPKDSLCPEAASGDDGFIHPTKIEGDLGHAEIHFIIRDFKTENLIEHANIIKSITEKVLQNYPNSSYAMDQQLQYRNMNDILEKNSHRFNLAIQACESADVIPKVKKIRGGTEGAVLTCMGRPCTNIFAGEQAIHSISE